MIIKKCIAVFLVIVLFFTSFTQFLQFPKAHAEELTSVLIVDCVDDGMGNARFLTNSTGGKLRSYDYDPYGNNRSTTGTTANNYQFNTQQLDPESGLYHLRARQYDPVTGRFISKDPIKGDIMRPQTQNPYAYSLNNPINLSDPSGEQVIEFCKQIATKLWPSANQAPQVVNGIKYGEHALERMAPVGLGGRGVPPSVVQNAIDYGSKAAGNVAGRIVHTFENVAVVTDDAIKEVITVIKTGH